MEWPLLVVAAAAPSLANPAELDGGRQPGPGASGEFPLVSMHYEYAKNSYLSQSCMVRAWISDSLLIEASKPIGAGQISVVGESVASTNRVPHL
jgi:hypothetical protein